MDSKNVETVRAAHESWNRRDFQGVVRDSSEGLVYTDNGRSLTLNGRDKFREWTEAWAKAFSDGRITNPKYIDAGDVVVTQFTVEGTNDGPLGSLPPSGRRISLSFCEVCQLDKATCTNQPTITEGALGARLLHFEATRRGPQCCSPPANLPKLTMIEDY